MVKNRDYIWARKLLSDEGSKSAQKSHDPHGNDGTVACENGKQLLKEAYSDFKEIDKNKNPLYQNYKITKDHYELLERAAKKMSLDFESIYLKSNET